MKKKIPTFLIVLVSIPVLCIFFSIITGYLKLFIILSGSMIPVANIGDAILIQKTSAEDIKVGDMIAFYQGKDLKSTVSHRVIEIYKENGNISFQTKGDNVEKKDPFIVESKHLIGKAVFRIPYIGYLTKFSKKPIFFMIFTIIPSILLLVGEIKNLSRTEFEIKRIERKEKKRKKKYEKLSNVNYKAMAIIIVIGTVIMYVAGISYIDPNDWKNFSEEPILYSVLSYIVIQAIILLLLSSFWIYNRHMRSKILSKILNVNL